MEAQDILSQELLVELFKALRCEDLIVVSHAYSLSIILTQHHTHSASHSLSITLTQHHRYTTWQVSHKDRGLARAPRAPNPYLCVVNLRTLPSLVYLMRLHSAIFER